MRFLIACSLSLLLQQTAFSQKFKLDSNYVQNLKERFLFVLHVSGQYNSLEIEQAVNPDSGKADLSYPTIKASLGFTFNWKLFNFSYGRNVFQYIFKDKHAEQVLKSGPATITNYGFTYNPNRLRFELYYRKVKGFHEDNRSEYDSNYTSTTPFYQYPEMTTRSIGMDVMWTYNIRKRFSIGAPYSYTTRQNKSAGSFIFYLAANNFNVSSSNAFIPPDVASYYGQFDDLKGFNASTLSAGVGWSYTLVFAKVFYVNATAIARYPFMFKTYEMADGTSLKETTVPEDPEIWDFAIGRCAAGINFKAFFISAYAYADSYDYRYYSNRSLGLGIRNFNVKGAFNVGFRFNHLWKKKKDRTSI